MAKLTPRRVAAALRRRLRRWARQVADARPRRHPAWREVPATAAPLTDDVAEVTVAGTAELRRWADRQDAAATVRRLRVVIEDWRGPRAGWSGRLGPLPYLVDHRLALPASGQGRAEVSIDLDRPVPVRRAVAAVLLALEPSAPVPRPASPETGLDEAGPPPVLVVDAATANPIGRRRYDARLAAGVLRLTPEDPGGAGRWWVARGPADPTPILAGRFGEPLDARQRVVLAGLASITCPAHREVPAEPYAALLAQLAMTGVLVHAPDLPGPVAELLGPELSALLARPPHTTDPIERELSSVGQRRAALRRHALGLARPAGAGPLSRPPSVTALLLTRRPDRLPTVLADLACQTYPELEVVVGLHGVDATAARAAAARHPGPIEVVTVPADVRFGAALGEAMRWAGGSLVTKVDDDDRYGREHIWDLVLARHYSGATVVGKGAEFVYLAPRDLTIRRPMDSEVYDRYVAGGTLLASRGDLEAVGGWRPVERSVDRALLDRVLAAGGLVYRTHGFGYLYTRHAEGHTWEVDLDRFEWDAVRRWPGLPPYDEFVPAPPVSEPA